MRLIRRIGSDEEGSAMAVAMATLVALLVISAWVFAGAIEINATSRNDSNSKRAYAAAEAGAQAAFYKLNKLNLQHVVCVIDVGGASPVGGECPSYPAAGQPAHSIGNGARYRYTVTPVLAGVDSCRDPFVTAATLPALLALNLNNVTDLERCITSTGYAGDEIRRVQMRVVSTLKLFEGIIADDKGDSGPDIEISRGTVAGQLGTNGKIKASGGSFVGNVEVPASIRDSYLEHTGGVFTAAVTTRDRPWALSPVDPGNTDEATNNNNGPINSNCTQLVVLPCSPAPYNIATRSFHLRSGQTATFTGSTYNFCSFRMDGGSTLNANLLGNASVFIDSPERSGSGCAAGSGSLNVSGTANPLTGALDAQKLSFYVVGASGQEPTVSGTGLLTAFTASIYAPDSMINLTGDALDIYKGAFSGKKVVIGNGTSGPSVTGLLDLPITLDGNLLKLYRPAGLKECRREPDDPSDPESGCPDP